MKTRRNFVLSGHVAGWVAALAVISLFMIPSNALGVDDDRFEPYVESHPDGRIDWDEQMIYGVGKGYLDKNGGSKNKALRAAQVTALQSILKIAAGVRLDDKKTLKDLGDGKVVINLQALIRYEDFGDPKFVSGKERPHFEVTRRAALSGVNGLSAVLLDHLKSSPLPWKSFPKPSPAVIDEPEEKTETWLVLDGRKLPDGERVQPGLFPKIASATGEVLYELGNVDEQSFLKEGMMKYAVSDTPAGDIGSSIGAMNRFLSGIGSFFSVREAMAQEKKEKREKRKRFIIKDVQKAEGLNKTNLVISEEDAKKLKAEDVSGQILKKCRVIVVVNSSIGGVEGSLPRWKKSGFFSRGNNGASHAEVLAFKNSDFFTTGSDIP